MVTRKPGKLGRKMGVSMPGKFMLHDYLVDPLPIWNEADDFSGTLIDWGMAGNDIYGCCGPAGDYHKNMADALVAKEKALVVPDDNTVQTSELTQEYLSFSGGDNGVDLGQWLTYRLTHTLAGLPVIGGFAQVAVSGEEFQSALHVFGGLYVGILLSQEAYNQYPGPWTSTATDWIGGHCVPILQRNNSHGTCITWGSKEQFSWEWWRVAREEAFVILSPEMMNTPGGVFHGVNVAALKADLAKLK